MNINSLFDFRNFVNVEIYETKFQLIYVKNNIFFFN
jgi:hypothetical protein